MTIAASARLVKLPPYLFAAIDAKKKAAIEKGADIISLGVGDPDLPTPPHVVISTSAVMPTESSPAPTQSMRCSVRYFGRCSRNHSQTRARPPSGRFT